MKKGASSEMLGEERKGKDNIGEQKEGKKKEREE